VDTLGWIEDPENEISTWSAMIIPIQTGGGTRIKIADAFSRKVPVVSTRYGAYGYDVKGGTELLLADSPRDFSAACVSLAKDTMLGAKLAETAWSRFLKDWSWDAIAPCFWSAAEDCLRRSRVATSGSSASR
jgi:glycosyltransferase involved in cell wall biosynthesis